MVLEKSLESPLDCKEIKPQNLKEINLEYSLEGLLLTVKVQYSGHLVQRDYSLGKILMMERLKANGEESGRG